MSTQTSQAYQVHLNDQSRDHTSPTALSNLSLATIPKPVPGPGEVLVRIRAAALNYRDLLVLVNSPLYPFATSPGLVPLADGAGEIEAVGPSSIWASSIGSGVILVPDQGWFGEADFTQFGVNGVLGAAETDGTLRQYAVVKDELLVKKPGNLSFKEAAAMTCTGATAVHALSVIDVGKGTTVLTLGTGGVSSMAISLASALGARVIATSSSDEKLQAAKKLGASDLINYKTHPEWSTEVLRLTEGKGADLVIEVSGAGTIQQSLASSKLGGVLSLVGYLSDSEASDIVPAIIYGAKTLKGIRGFSKGHLQYALELVEKHDLHPLVGKAFEWEDAPKAFETLRKGDFVGKLVVKV